MTGRYPTLRLARSGTVLTVRVTNPPTDLLDGRVMADLDRLTRALQHKRAIAAVIVTGPRPGVFVPHYDLGEIQEGSEALGRHTPYALARPALSAVAALSRVPGGRALLRRTPADGLLSIIDTHRTLSRFGRLPQVVVAAIEGDAVGGGCELALACDVRVMADGDLRIGLPELSAGIPPGAGGTQRLAQVVGPLRALSLVLRAQTLTPAAAQAAGLVDEVVPAAAVLPTAEHIAGIAAGWNPAAVMAAKRAIRGSAERIAAVGLRREAAGFVAAASGAEAVARLRRFTAESDAAAGVTPWRDRSGLPAAAPATEPSPAPRAR